MSVSCNPMLATMGALASTPLADILVYVLMGGLEMIAVKTLMTVQQPYALMGPPAMTVWRPSSASAPLERQVSTSGKHHLVPSSLQHLHNVEFMLLM